MAGTVDWIAAKYAAQGDECPLESALREYRELEKAESGKLLSEETIRDYYRKGVRDHARADAEFAREINHEARRLEEEGASNAVDAALAASARGNPEYAYVDRVRFERGLRRLQEAEKK